MNCAPPFAAARRDKQLCVGDYLPRVERGGSIERIHCAFYLTVREQAREAPLPPAGRCPHRVVRPRFCNSAKS